MTRIINFQVTYLLPLLFVSDFLRYHKKKLRNYENEISENIYFQYLTKLFLVNCTKQFPVNLLIRSRN